MSRLNRSISGVIYPVEPLDYLVTLNHISGEARLGSIHCELINCMHCIVVYNRVRLYSTANADKGDVVKTQDTLEPKDFTVLSFGIKM